MSDLRPGHGPSRGMRPAVAVGVAAGLVTAALGLVGAGRSYDYDEAVTIARFVRPGSPWRALTTQVVFNNHPAFSALQSITWRLGLTTEAAQRVTPVLFGALAVALVAAWSARRWGPVAGVVAGLSLALNPMLLAQLRSVRGYSLATLAVVVAGLALLRSLEDRRRRWLVLQGAAMALAVATHAYSAVAIVLMAVAVVATRRLEPRLVLTWTLAAAAAFVSQLAVLDDQLDQSRERGRRWRAGFPVDLARELLGHSGLVVLVTGTLAIVGAVAIARTSPPARRGGLAVAGTLLLVIAAIWLVARPTDLYPRFFISLTPFIAVLVGRGVAELPRPADLAAATVVAILLVPGALDVVQVRPTIREAAAVVDAARDLGLRPCARNALPLEAYTTAPPVVRSPDDLKECDVVVFVGTSPTALREAADERYAEGWSLGGGVEVYATVDRNAIDEQIASRRDGP